jgi:hypothetical protein
MIGKGYRLIQSVLCCLLAPWIVLSIVLWDGSGFGPSGSLRWLAALLPGDPTR